MTAASAPVEPGTAPAGARIEGRGIRVRLGRAQVLDGVDVSVAAGSWLGVVGPNGAGKSTLLRALAGLARYDGDVLVDGQQIWRLRPRVRARQIGYAPQTPVIPPGASVTDYVMLGRTPYRSLLAAPRTGDGEVVAEAIHRLDLGHAQQVLELVDRLRSERGLTVVSTLHDLTLAGQYADELLLLAGGRVVAAGPAHRVLTVQTLADHYQASAEVTSGPDGVRVHPVRPA